jgi:thiol-disulfide isomerase/thioredoxin
MKKWIILLLLPLSTLNAQNYKEDISVVQYSAPFTKDAEISLKPFKDHNTYTFYITEKKKIFDEDDVVYLPTLILYYNGKEVIRVEAGISLKYPEDAEQQITKEIEKIIESKF